MYTWAAHPSKLQRAIAKAKEQSNTDGTKFSEELVKEWYVKLAGQILEIEPKRKAKNANKDSDLDSEE